MACPRNASIKKFSHLCKTIFTLLQSNLHTFAKQSSHFCKTNFTFCRTLFTLQFSHFCKTTFALWDNRDDFEVFFRRVKAARFACEKTSHLYINSVPYPTWSFEVFLFFSILFKLESRVCHMFTKLGYSCRSHFRVWFGSAKRTLTSWLRFKKNSSSAYVSDSWFFAYLHAQWSRPVIALSRNQSVIGIFQLRAAFSRLIRLNQTNFDQLAAT